MKKFIVIAKIDNQKFVKYHTVYLDKFFIWLLKKYPNFRFANIYDQSTKLQIGNFTKKTGIIKN